MKKTNKIIAIIAAVTMLAGMLFVFQSTSFASDNPPRLDIAMCNLSFRSNICIKYAVTSDSTSEVSLLVWDAPQSEYTYGTHTKELETVGNQELNGNTYMVFDYTDLAVKQMTDVVYARAYTVVDGSEYYSDVVKYSILQYAYNMLGKTGTATDNENLKTALTDMLKFGASAQNYLEYKTDRLATDEFYQVIISGGLIDDQCNHGLYLEGDVINVSAAEQNQEGIPFSAWKDSNGNVVSNTAVSEITVGAKNETYEAVYGADDEEDDTPPVITEPTFIVNDVNASAGDTVEVKIDVVNNPGVLGANLKVEYDDTALKMTNCANGDAFSVLTFSRPSPSKLKNGYVFSWYGEYIEPTDISDGTVITLTFDVLETATAGNYEVKISYMDGDVVDNDLNPLSLDIINGDIIVS